MLAPESILQNRYRIIRELGQGGMGAVYEAIDQRVRSHVALKETLVGSDAEARAAFEREAALLANLRHAALPKVMDYFSENDSEFLVMEYVPGSDLAELLDRRGSPFPQMQVLHWADKVLSVLEYLHTRDPPILHRDIKPSNLKVTEQGEIFLLDFGLAKGAAGQMPTIDISRSVRGYTPAYSPIEQIAGRGTDPRSDLYALGATLYHLLAGQGPVDAPTRFAAMEEDRPDPLVPVHHANSNVSAGLAEIIGRAMAVSRRDRLSSANEMRRELSIFANQTQAAGAQDTFLPELAVAPKVELHATAASEPPPTVPSSDPLDSAPEETPSPTIASSPPAAATLPANQFLLRDRLPNPVVITEPTLAARRIDGSRAGTIAVIVVVSLMVVGAIAITVWLLTRGGQTATTNSQPADLNRQIASPGSTNSPQHETVAANLNGVPLEMVLIPAGEFVMGSDTDIDAAKPRHRVIISHPFYAGKYEVTQGQWSAVMGKERLDSGTLLNPVATRGVGDTYPMYDLNWNDVHEFLTRLNALDSARTYRLPTEAEWEYACRAGSVGDDNRDLATKAWYQANADSYPHPVGLKQPNAFGLYDMLGNVFEICQDFFNAEYYRGSPSKDPQGPLAGQFRVIRGGGFTTGTGGMESVSASNRVGFEPTARGGDVGFRLVAVPRTK